MPLSAAIVLMLAAEPAGAPTCPLAQEVRVFHKEARWWLDKAGLEAVADVAAFVRSHPLAEVWLMSDYYAAGNTAVYTVDEAFKVHKVDPFDIWITSGPRGGPAPTPPDGYMDVSIQIDCDG
ncbi:MAG: hypothetical protein WC068_06495 [Caulobacter sp.]